VIMKSHVVRSAELVITIPASGVCMYNHTACYVYMYVTYAYV